MTHAPSEASLEIYSHSWERPTLTKCTSSAEGPVDTSLCYSNSCLLFIIKLKYSASLRRVPPKQQSIPTLTHSLHNWPAHTPRELPLATLTGVGTLTVSLNSLTYGQQIRTFCKHLSSKFIQSRIFRANKSFCYNSKSPAFLHTKKVLKSYH